VGIVNKKKGMVFEIPHEPGQWMRIRPLTYQEVTEARNEGSRKTLERSTALLQAIPAATLEQLKDKQSVRQAQDPQDEFDVPTVLRHAIIGWSYSEKDEEPTVEDIDSLDVETAEWAFEIARKLIEGDHDFLTSSSLESKLQS
jgi:hypothetical protein